MRSKAQLTAWAVLLVAMAVAVVGTIIYQFNPIMAQESGGSSSGNAATSEPATPTSEPATPTPSPTPGITLPEGVTDDDTRVDKDWGTVIVQEISYTNENGRLDEISPLPAAVVPPQNSGTGGSGTRAHELIDHGLDKDRLLAPHLSGVLFYVFPSQLDTSGGLGSVESLRIMRRYNPPGVTEPGGYHVLHEAYPVPLGARYVQVYDGDVASRSEYDYQVYPITSGGGLQDNPAYIRVRLSMSRMALEGYGVEGGIQLHVSADGQIPFSIQKAVVFRVTDNSELHLSPSYGPDPDPNVVEVESFYPATQGMTVLDDDPALNRPIDTRLLLPFVDDIHVYFVRYYRVTEVDGIQQEEHMSNGPYIFIRKTTDSASAPLRVMAAASNDDDGNLEGYTLSWEKPNIHRGQVAQYEVLRREHHPLVDDAPVVVGTTKKLRLLDSSNIGDSKYYEYSVRALHKQGTRGPARPHIIVPNTPNMLCDSRSSNGVPITKIHITSDILDASDDPYPFLVDVSLYGTTEDGIVQRCIRADTDLLYLNRQTFYHHGLSENCPAVSCNIMNTPVAEAPAEARYSAEWGQFGWGAFQSFRGYDQPYTEVGVYQHRYEVCLPKGGEWLCSNPWTSQMVMHGVSGADFTSASVPDKPVYQARPSLPRGD